MPWPTKERTTPKPWLLKCAWTAWDTSPSGCPAALHDGLVQALAGDVEELLDPRRHRAHRQGDRAVRVIPPHDTAEVQPDDVAFPELALGRGDPVDHLLVDRGAHRRRKTPVAPERRLRRPRETMKASTSVSISLVEMPGPDQCAQPVLHLGEDPSRRPHVRELACRLEQDHRDTGSLTARG